MNSHESLPGSSAGDHREDGHFVLRGQGGRETAREPDVSSVDQEDHHRAHGSLVEHGIAECGPVAVREHFQETGDVRKVVVELVGILPRELAKRREILDAHRSSSIRFAGRGGPAVQSHDRTALTPPTPTSYSDSSASLAG